MVAFYRFGGRASLNYLVVYLYGAVCRKTQAKPGLVNIWQYKTSPKLYMLYGSASCTCTVHKRITSTTNIVYGSESCKKNLTATVSLMYDPIPSPLFGRHIILEYNP